MQDAGAQELLDRLADHRAIAHAPAREHGWLASHGTLRRYAAGEVITAKGELAKELLVLFEGRVVIRVDRGAGSHKIIEWFGGDVGGAMPYSRGAAPPNDAVAEEATELLAIDKSWFQEMIRECPTVTTALVHAMVDRVRRFNTGDLRDEKLLSLGKLAAGLAHELNNPASAAVRSANLLRESLDAAEEAARRLGAARLSDAQLAAVDEVRALCAAPPPMPSSSVARADREDAIAAWLGERGADQACAMPLAETAVTLPALDGLAAQVERAALHAALRWIAAGCLVRTLASEIEHAASRIHDLVGSVKGFSYMGRAAVPEPVDIRRGIADTIRLVEAKRREKAVDVSVEIPDDLPRVHAVGAELNQVWMNLIENALDAVEQGGSVTVSASRELDHLVVRVIDDGPGVPPEIQGRVFDPFFTTKGVGQGTGLGLDVVRRLVQQHEGEVALESRPGRTEFQVRLPLTNDATPRRPASA